MERISIHISSRDRHSEVSLLLQSLRTQCYQAFDVCLLDDSSGTPVVNCYFIMSLVQRLQLEGHGVRIIRNDFSRGVCAARNKLIDSDPWNDNPLVLRLDDDVILEPNYIEKLVAGLDKGFDAVSGVVPLLAHPESVRENKFVNPVINYHEFDSEGNIVRNNDDCGYCYIDNEYLPTHQFRTNLLYKRSVTDAGVRYPDYLTKVGFREELFFSFEMLTRGFKLGVCTGAKAYHLQCPSGGCRSNSYAEDVALDDMTARNWAKQQYLSHGNFLEVKKE